MYALFGRFEKLVPYHNLSPFLGHVADRCRSEVEVPSLEGAQYHCMGYIAGSEVGALRRRSKV